MYLLGAQSAQSVMFCHMELGYDSIILMFIKNSLCKLAEVLPEIIPYLNFE